MKSAGPGETWTGQCGWVWSPPLIAAPSPRLSGCWFEFCCFASQLSLLSRGWGLGGGSHSPPSHPHQGWGLTGVAKRGLTFKQLRSSGPRLAPSAAASTAQLALSHPDAPLGWGAGWGLPAVRPHQGPRGAVTAERQPVGGLVGWWGGAAALYPAGHFTDLTRRLGALPPDSGWAGGDNSLEERMGGARVSPRRVF